MPAATSVRGRRAAWSACAGSGARARLLKGSSDGTTRPAERPILREHPPLEIPERLARLDPQLFDEGSSRVAVNLERLAHPAAAVEREHQLGPEPLAQWMLRDQPPELRHEVHVAAQRELALQPILERGEPQLLEAPYLALRGGVVDEIGERRPAPEAQRRAELVHGLGCPAVRQGGAALLDEPLRLEQVELGSVQSQPVAAVDRLDQARVTSGVAYRRAQARDLGVQPVRHALGWVLAPEHLDDPLAADHLVRPKAEQGEQRALLGTPERDFPPVGPELRGTE